MSVEQKIIEQDHSMYWSELPLHKNAKATLQKHSHDIHTYLLTESQLIAHRQGADIVLSCHVNEAIERNSRTKSNGFYRELISIVGAVFLGAFVDGFFPHLLQGNTLLVALYVIFGFGGMLAVVWSLRN